MGLKLPTPQYLVQSTLILLILLGRNRHFRERGFHPSSCMNVLAHDLKHMLTASIYKTSLFPINSTIDCIHQMAQLSNKQSPRFLCAYILWYTTLCVLKFFQVYLRLRGINLLTRKEASLCTVTMRSRLDYKGPMWCHLNTG